MRRGDAIHQPNQVEVPPKEDGSGEYGTCFAVFSCLLTPRLVDGGAGAVPASRRPNVMMPDEILVSTIVGKKVSYEHHGRVIEDVEMNTDRKYGIPGKLDLRTFETAQDLYWWYARQDAFQSIISGNPLM